MNPTLAPERTPTLTHENVRARKQRRNRPPLAATLLNWRDTPAFGLAEAFILAGSMAVVALVIPRHERWADEVQAWYLANDNSVWDILRHRMHYEGAPALWHLILHAFGLLGGTVFTMNWLGAAFAAAGIFVLLRWSPFPLLLRALLPFTYFFAYQYAVIARGYTLFGVLCFGLCALYTRPRQWVWFIVLAGLLANLSLQGAVAGVLIVALYLVDRIRSPAAESRSSEARGVRFSTSAPSISSAVSPALLFVPFLILAGVVAVPAPDVNFAVANQVSEGLLHRMLVRFPGELPKTQPDPPPNPRLPPEAEQVEPARHLLAPGEWLGWYVDHTRRDANGVDLGQSMSQAALEFFFGIASQATWPVATSKLLACLFLALWLCWLRTLRFLRGAVVWLALILVGQVLWVADHHAGMILIALLTAVWIARIRPRPQRSIERENRSLDRAFVLTFALVAALQLHWTYACIRNDLRGSYAPGSDTAEVLQNILTHNPSARIAGFDSMAATVQPFFGRNPFFNLPHRFWIWSETDNPNAQHRATIATRPDAVLFTDEMPDDGLMRNTWAILTTPAPAAEQRDLTRNPIVNDLRANGYLETHRFCGHRFSRAGSSFVNCHLIFEPSH